MGNPTRIKLKGKKNEEDDKVYRILLETPFDFLSSLMEFFFYTLALCELHNNRNSVLWGPFSLKYYGFKNEGTLPSFPRTDELNTHSKTTKGVKFAKVLRI